MTLQWIIGSEASTQDLDAISQAVISHGRSQAIGGDARPIACLVRDGEELIAGGSGRTEYTRLFVNYLWVAEDRRRQGLARRILQELESEAARRGCRDAIIETLDDDVAALYARLGYRTVAHLPRYVGPFNRHILLKVGLTPDCA
ncbi:MAG: GNAT family N-acetyltransferase [Rubrivivax sp.]